MAIQLRNVNVVPEGDGVDVKRLFPLPGFMNFDPFVLWDHFTITPGRGFPDHPHRGFEAITYMFEGGMQHKDNLGNESFVTAGGAQRFTAGRGLVHSEMPADTGKSNGIQLWINLPKRLKQTDPAYQQVNQDAFPVNSFSGGQAKIIVGDNSPLILHTEVIYQHIKLDKNAVYRIALKENMQGIVYLTSGSIVVNGQKVTEGQAAFINTEPELTFQANDNSEFMLCFGIAHNEPIRQHGPFVD